MVIVGGGTAGVEEGIHWAEKGKQVTIIEKNDVLAPYAPFVYRQSLLLECEKKNDLRILLGTKCVAIEEKQVRTINDQGEEQVFPADTVLLATGVVPLRVEAESFRDCAKEFRIIGDCRKPQTVFDANKDGYNVAMGLTF